jgi:D-glycero-alpha-D-manno-heptose-7-phosphate kinase
MQRRAAWSARHGSGASSTAREALERVHQLKRDAVKVQQALLRGEIRHVAAILNRSWPAKQRTARGVSNSHIEELHAAALAHGAIAGEVSGSGCGGIFMFIVPPHNRAKLIRGLNQMRATASAVHFTGDGA